MARYTEYVREYDLGEGQWVEREELDDLDPMSDPGEYLEDGEIDVGEEAFMRGFGEALEA